MKTSTKVIIAVAAFGALVIILIVASIGSTAVALSHDPGFQAKVQEQVQEIKQEQKDIATVEAAKDVSWMLTDPAYVAWMKVLVKSMDDRGLDAAAQRAEIQTKSAELWKGVYRLPFKSVRARVSLICSMANATDDADMCADVATTGFSRQGKHFNLLNEDQQAEWIKINKEIVHDELNDDPDPTVIDNNAVFQNFVQDNIPEGDMTHILRAVSGEASASDKCWLMRYLCSTALALPRDQSSGILRWIATQ